MTNKESDMTLTPSYSYVRNLHEYIGDKRDMNYKVPGKLLAELVFSTYILASNAQKLKLNYIISAINKGLFLKYNHYDDKYEFTKEHDILIKLKDSINSYKEISRNIKDVPGANKILNFYNRPYFNSDELEEVKGIDLFIFLKNINIQKNIYIISSAIYRKITGLDIKCNDLKLFPEVPFSKTEQSFKNSEPTDNDIIHILTALSIN